MSKAKLLPLVLAVPIAVTSGTMATFLLAMTAVIGLRGLQGNIGFALYYSLWWGLSDSLAGTIATYSLSTGWRNRIAIGCVVAWPIVTGLGFFLFVAAIVHGA